MNKKEFKDVLQLLTRMRAAQNKAYGYSKTRFKQDEDYRRAKSLERMVDAELHYLKDENTPLRPVIDLIDIEP